MPSSSIRPIFGRFYIPTFYTNTILLFALLLHPSPAESNTYSLAAPNTDLVGELRTVKARASDTLMDIARSHGVGHGEIRQANPEVDIWLPGEGREVTIPSQFLLPDAPREGIVLNRGEMRLYYFHADPDTGESLVTTYPVGIGRADRQTPTGRGRITMKLRDPAWYPTENVRADYAARGETLAPMVPPGPDNPLGEYAMMLDIPGFLIHGTNRPDGIGMRVSQGCVRLYPEDIEALVKRVDLETPVTIVDQSHKVGLVNGRLAIEIHPEVYGQADERGAGREQGLIRRIMKLLDAREDELAGSIDWERVSQAVERADGMPTVVSVCRDHCLPTEAEGNDWVIRN